MVVACDRKMIQPCKMNAVRVQKRPLATMVKIGKGVTPGSWSDGSRNLQRFRPRCDYVGPKALILDALLLCNFAGVMARL
jgi:hypothetical protein